MKFFKYILIVVAFGMFFSGAEVLAFDTYEECTGCYDDGYDDCTEHAGEFADPAEGVAYEATCIVDVDQDCTGGTGCDSIDYVTEETEEGGVGDGGTGDSTTISGSGTAISIDNPLGRTTLESLYVNVINAVMGIVGGLAFLVFVYNGFRFIFAGGNDETVGKAKKGMFWAAAGVLLILTSYTIVQYVFTTFGFIN